MRTTETSNATAPAGTPSTSAAAQSPAAARTRKPLHRRPVVRIVVGAIGIVLSAAMVTAAWAYDEYVADHVEIADVTSYEQSVLQEQTATTLLPSPESTAPIEMDAQAGSADTVPEVAAAFTDTSYVADGVSITVGRQSTHGRRGNISFSA